MELMELLESGCQNKKPSEKPDLQVLIQST